MSNIEYKPAEKLQLVLTRPDPGTSWGFRLQGGTDFNTPLSIQSVNPDSVADKCGLKAGDAILTINSTTSDTMTHDEAKAEIMRSGNEISMLVERGAVQIWKPKVTPFTELRPLELKPFTCAIDEDIQPIQKTSLAANKSPDEPCRIGSSHNRSPQPFGVPRATSPNIAHPQYNSPLGLYSSNNIADTYNQQTAGLQSHLQSLDIKDASADLRESGYEPEVGMFRPVRAPVTRPNSETPQQQSMTCGGCNILATGVIVRANDVPYHAACFKCTSCSINLKQKGYFVVGGKLYCETHAKPPEPDKTSIPA